MKEESDDENEDDVEDDVEEDEPTGAAEEKEDKNPELIAFLKQVKDKKGKLDVFNEMQRLKQQLELASEQSVKAEYEEKIEVLVDEVQTLRNINNAVQQKWNNAKRQKLADKEGISVNEIQDTAVNYTGATQEIMDWDEE